MPLVLVGDDGRTSKIDLQLKYVPVKMTLHPAESINNMGTLRCDVLDAADLPAADRNGLSDPYCKIYLNEQEVFKTAVQKKTLHPSWNEFFEIPIASRTAAQFRIDVYDRDIGEKDDFLGSASANLQLLEPFVSQEVSLRLNGISGVLRIKLLFRSSYVTRSRIGSATFSGTFAAPGRVVGAPVKGFGRAASSFLGRGFGRRTESKVILPGEEDFGTNNTPVATVDSNGHSSHLSADSNQLNASSSGFLSRSPQNPSYLMSSYSTSYPGTSITPDTTSRTPPEQGTVTFHVTTATGFTGHNVRAIIKQQIGKGMKEVYKSKTSKATPEGVVHWHDSSNNTTNDVFTTRCTSDTYFTIQLKDVHTFGADQDYGEAPLKVTGGIGGQQTVRIASGTVLVGTEWRAVQQVMDGTNSVSGLSVDTTGADGTVTDMKSPRGRLRKTVGGVGGLLHREKE